MIKYTFVCDLCEDRMERDYWGAAPSDFSQIKVTWGNCSADYLVCAKCTPGKINRKTFVQAMISKLTGGPG